jgi:deoxyribodipyrimidine photo-lyase
VNGPTTFLRELAWREFFYQVLWFRPRVEREAFLPAYAGIPWENRETWFEAWKAGRTGYALVDAGMRELAATGFMHNRARMVVASFLVKDLLVDWRWGERYFMERLLDGDLAPNNGGWQWAASTGCDAQPYFRVFNPTLQGQRFDPTGAYIQRWVPERRALTGKDVHAPREPVVAHDRQKEKVIALFRGAAPGPGPAPAARSAPPRKR